ncbi:hypothetical protein B0H14DRAFT_2566564 [Mycena olivaceomarginata]|nr:hypothetical protein B0H14DRAFT_2566564 [Mycena olivaceomarginata]
MPRQSYDSQGGARGTKLTPKSFGHLGAPSGRRCRRMLLRGRNGTCTAYTVNAGAVPWQAAIHALIVEAIRRDEASKFYYHKYLGKALNGLLPQRARLEDLGNSGWNDPRMAPRVESGLFTIPQVSQRYPASPRRKRCRGLILKHEHRTTVGKFIRDQIHDLDEIARREWEALTAPAAITFVTPVLKLSAFPALTTLTVLGRYRGGFPDATLLQSVSSHNVIQQLHIRIALLRKADLESLRALDINIGRLPLIHLDRVTVTISRNETNWTGKDT